MVYVEENHVSVNEDVILVKKELADESLLTGKLIFDAMTGPSPSGAPIIDQVQTLTSPSGSTTVIQPGEETNYVFHDTRYALILDWEKQISRLVKWVHSSSISGCKSRGAFPT